MNSVKTLAITALIAGASLAPIAASAEGVTNSGNASRSGSNTATAGTSSMPGDASATATNAGETGTVSSQTFSRLDADRSGTLTEAEFNKQASAAVSFSDLDANADGTLTLSELQNR